MEKLASIPNPVVENRYQSDNGFALKYVRAPVWSPHILSYVSTTSNVKY